MRFAHERTAARLLPNTQSGVGAVSAYEPMTEDQAERDERLQLVLKQMGHE